MDSTSTCSAQRVSCGTTDADGYRDERLGQRACAMLMLQEGTTLRLDELCDHLLEAGLSKHYLPERLELLPEL